MMAFVCSLYGCHLQLKAVGDQSVNQAVKAVAIARSYLQEEGMDICLQVRSACPDPTPLRSSVLALVQRRSVPL
jgi:hypothetical protein